MRLVLVAAALVLGWAAPALAQMTVTKLSVGTRTADELDLPISAEECAADIPITLRVMNAAMTARLDFWSGTSCNTVESRTTGTLTCEYLPMASTTRDGSQQDIVVTMSTLLIDCTAGTSTTTFFILPVATTMSTEMVSDFAMFTVALDAQAPGPPTGLTTGAGETAIPLSWTAPTGSDIHEYNIYIDDAAADCASTTLVAGSPPPTEGVRIVTVNGDATETTLSGIATGTEAAVAISAVDDAGNVGVLSEVVCAMSVPTEGFWDKYKGGGGSASTCAAAPGPRGGGGSGSGAPWALLGAACALAMRVRRHR